MDKSIEIPVNIDISDKDIERLEKVKQLLKDIKEIDDNFSLSNIIEADEDTILVFNCKAMIKKQYLNDIQERLEHETGYKCIVLDDYIRLDKAIKADYSKEKDYITETYYDGRGNIISEKTIQYK